MSDRILTSAEVEAIADAIARKLADSAGAGLETIAKAIARELTNTVGAASATFGLVDAQRLAEELGVSTDYVYAHALELGAMRLGTGPKARIRFDLDQARRALEARTRGANGKRRRR